MEDLNIFQEKDGEFTGPRQALIKDVRIPFYEPNIDKDFEKDLSRFETRPDDVYVVSYPKSGRIIVKYLACWHLLIQKKVIFSVRRISSFHKTQLSEKLYSTDMETKGRNGNKPSSLLKGACADRRCVLEYVAL